MTRDSRNTRVTVCLVLSMTLGAAVLMWLQPSAVGWPRDALPMMAERGGVVEAVTIEWITPEILAADYATDCVIRPGSELADWHPRSGLRELRISLVQARDGRLDPAQAQTLLRVLGTMRYARELDLRSVSLHPDSDPTRRRGLTRDAHELRDLLTRKGILQ